MSNRNAIVVLLVAVLLLAGANVMVRRAPGRLRTSRRMALVDPSDDSFSRIVLERRGGAKIVLVRTAEWQMVEPYAGSADERSVAQFLDVLAMTQPADFISDSELLKLGRTRADFSLSSPLLRVSVRTDDGEETVSFGMTTPTSNGVYVAIGGLDGLSVVPLDAFERLNRPADFFRRRASFRIGAEAVDAFDVKRGGGSLLAFRRDGDGWTVGGRKMSERKVRAFLMEVTDSKAVDFVWPTGATQEVDRATGSLLSGYGLDPEGATTVTLKGADGVIGQISIGKDAAPGLVYALVQDGRAIVTVPASLRDSAMGDADFFADSRLFSVDSRAVGAITLLDGDISCVVVRDKDGSWRLESPVTAPADPTAMEAVLSRVLALSSSDVSASGVSISIQTNTAPICVAREKVLGDGGLELLRSLEIVRIDPLLVKRLVRTESGGKPLSVVYGRDQRVWNVESDRPSQAVSRQGVEQILSAINPLHAERVVKLKVLAADLDDYGLDRPYLTLAVDQDREDAVRRNIIVGRKTRGGRFATIGVSDAVFVISEATVRRLSVPLTED